MNKTLSIALAGFSFIIEEHAYIKLSDYLAALRNTLDANEADEVMHDIEIRMVEIFKEHLGKREVLNTEDVERVIAQIGKPEQIEEQEDAYFSEYSSQQTKTNATTAQKQLFRDPSQQKIAGVCAGLAQYVGLDVSLMRAIWLGMAFLGIFTAAVSTTLIIIVYIILWIVLPTAKTASDFLKMKGQPVNFDTLKEESNKLLKFANDSSQKVGELYNENKPYINSAGQGIWNVVRYVLGGTLAFMAISCFLGIFAIFGLFGIDNMEGFNQLDYIFEDQTSFLLKILMTIGILIPTLLFGLLSIKLLSPKTKIRNLGFVLGGLFVVLLGLGTYFGVAIAKNDMLYKGYKEDTEEIAINTDRDTLYVDLKKVEIPQKLTAYDSDLFSDKKIVFEGDHPDIEITQKADVKTPYLIVKKNAKGYNVPMEMNIPVEIIGNKILLPNFIKYPYQHRFRDYNVDYELVVPENTSVISLSDKIDIDDDENFSNPNAQDNSSSSSSISIDNGKITINGKTLSFSDKDSVIIDNKKYSKKEAEKIIGKDVDNIKKEVETEMKNLEKDMKDLEQDLKELSKEF
ncbi:PspC domain-containing protein [Bergeyella porcorum]|uniref:PspC domain-containing protein n=1 Tax=Bergeyella porcorum TaxID=1735111 RepID=UPI0035EAB376